MTSITEMVKDNKKVIFLYYQNQELWYETETGFKFPVPIADTNTAMFLPTDKALLFMRWIRKHLNYINNAHVDQSEESLALEVK